MVVCSVGPTRTKEADSRDALPRSTAAAGESLGVHSGGGVSVLGSLLIVLRTRAMKKIKLFLLLFLKKKKDFSSSFATPKPTSPRTVRERPHGPTLPAAAAAAGACKSARPLKARAAWGRWAATLTGWPVVIRQSSSLNQSIQLRNRIAPHSSSSPSSSRPRTRSTDSEG